MKKLLVIICIVLVQMTALADKKSPIDKAKAKTEEMTKDLDLSPEQQKKVYELNMKAYAAIDAYEAKKPSKKLKKKQKQIVQDMRKAEYKKILTTAQLKKMEALKKAEKEKEKAAKKEMENSLKAK